MAERSSLTPNYIGTVEHGQRDPSLSTILALARGLGVAPGELLGGIGETGPLALEASRLIEAHPPDVQEAMLELLRSMTRRRRFDRGGQLQQMWGAMRLQVAVPASLLLLSLTALAHAEGQPDSAAEKPQRRSDFAFGASGGLAFGRAEGYPNKVQDLGDPAFKSNTHLALGSAKMFWLGVAFNDYLSFGFSLGAADLSGNDRKAHAGLFGFHIDAYPLFDVDPNLRDLALFGQFGTGPLTITGGPEKADGGLVAYVEGGIAYERLRFWHFGFGPALSLQHLWSETASSTEGVAGLRLAFYGGP